jgi:digeranylgeranylglycerophospholipid reductase
VDGAQSLRDVVIIGAGPAGLHAAHQLAIAGLDVVVFEARMQVGEGAVCSGVIGEEAFARFSLPGNSVSATLHWIQAISPSGKKLEHRTEMPLARVVDKAEFNRALGVRAVAAGVDIQPGRYVDSIEHEKDSVVLSFRSIDKERQKLRARVAIIASGVNGSLNRVLGLSRPRQLLRAMQCDLSSPNGNGIGPTSIYVGRAIAPGAFGWKIPMGGGKSRVGVMTTDDPKPYFKKLLQRIDPTLDDTQLVTSQKAIAQAPVGKCTMERVLAIGEAAGHVKTSTGGGIYYGLMSAEFAVEVVRQAFQKGDFSAQVLSEFERYWRTAFGNELLVGFFAREAASRFPDSLIERIFDSAAANNFLARLNGKLKFDWHHKALLTALHNWMILPGGGRAR